MAEAQSPFKADTLSGRVALITGGGSGIGLEITRQLGLHGAKVIITGRRQHVLEAAAVALRQEGIHVTTLQGDVRSAESAQSWVDTAVKQLGGLDILVNCAAGNFLATAEQLSPNGFRTVMDIDALGTFNTSRAAFPALSQSRHGGCIINISATLHYGATWYQVHASAAKAAVDSLTRSLALEWGQEGIRVVGVAPGPIRGTAGVTKLSPESLDKLEERFKSEIPIGHMGDKWDIAMACVFLASPAARFVSGDTLVVDGAAWIWRPSVLPREAVSQRARSVEAKSRAVGTAAGAARSKL